MSGLPAGPFGVTLGCVAAGLAVMLGVTFVIALRVGKQGVGKHSVVDTAWGLGIALAAVVALVSSIGYGQPARRYTLAAAAVIWGLRLAIYIGWRNHGKPEDPRYADMLAKAKPNPNLYALRSVYLLQGVLLFVACLPIHAGMLERAPAGPLVVIGALLWAAGFVFESVGDWQLYRFKANPAHQGMIMDRGLWHYTRHPNYFGDFCMWWGLFLISIGSVIEIAFVVAPILMTYILTRGTGAAMTDRRMTASRPKYADYVTRTSGFFPLPPRRHPARLTPGGCSGRGAAGAVQRARCSGRGAAGDPGPRGLGASAALRSRRRVTSDATSSVIAVIMGPCVPRSCAVERHSPVIPPDHGSFCPVFRAL